MHHLAGIATRLSRRALAVAAFTIAVTAAVLGTSATPVSAHGGGPDATNYRSVILSPGMEGLDWTMYGGDSLLELTNRTGNVVVVEGYDQEPYLRFVPGDGVYENVHSPATYYNDKRYADVTLPPEADADLEPQWRKVAGGETYSWHDHRAHWMSPVPPSPVFNDPSTDQQVFTWVIPVHVTADGSTHIVQVTGELWWIAPTPWWPPVVVLGTVFLGIAAIAMWRTRPAGPNWPGLARPVVALVVALVVADVLGTIDDIIASPALPGQHVSVALTTTVAALVVLGLARHAWRGEPTGFAALAGAGLALFLIFGIGHGSELSASQLLTVWPHWIRRWTVAANLVIMLPVTAVVVREGVHLFGYLRAHPVTFRRTAVMHAGGGDVGAD